MRAIISKSNSSYKQFFVKLYNFWFSLSAVQIVTLRFCTAQAKPLLRKRTKRNNCGASIMFRTEHDDLIIVCLPVCGKTDYELKEVTKFIIDICYPRGINQIK